MKELTTYELRKVQIDILKYLHNLCEENNLLYYLAYGTLIGAVRHKGYIPWDDDIDVYMPIDDFKKACKLMNSKKNKYVFLNCEEFPEYPISFGKIMRTDTVMYEKNNSFNKMDLGVNIDVFPIVPVDNKKIENKKDKIDLRCFFYRCKSLTPIENENMFKKIVKQAIHLSMFLVNFNNNARKIVEERDECRGNDFFVELSEYSDFRHDITDFSERVLLEFEGERYYAPKEYDKILSKVYGDYMTMPKEKDRVSTHKSISFYK